MTQILCSLCLYMNAPTPSLSMLTQMGMCEPQRCCSFVGVIIIVLLFRCEKCCSFDEKKCNLYQGRWVYDENYPLYESSKCPFVRKEFNCLNYGRTDHFYLHYGWQPNNCNLPRFDGKEFLERLKGKKIMFVGDSLSLNHWESLICMLHAAVPDSNMIMEANASVSTLTFKDYDVRVSLFHSLFLVDVQVQDIGRVLKLDSINDGDVWKTMDVLIFNTWNWWYRRGPKQPWDYVQDRGMIVKDMDRMVAFGRALETWAKWVDSHVDPARTRVFFQGISPSHYNGMDWRGRGGDRCANETRPVRGSVYPAGWPAAAYVVKQVIRKAVHLLDITTLSQLRKDGHPATHNGFGVMDCLHWCIAGVPDTWNQLLNAALINPLV